MATLHYVITKNFDVYVEGKNLTNSIVRSYLNGDRSLVWANGEATRERHRRRLHCLWSKLCARHGLSLLNKHRNPSCDWHGELHE